MDERKSIVLVTVDCLRADHTGFMGYTRPTTPFLDRLARESFVFPNAIVGGVPTYYSFPAMMASRYSLAWGRDVLGVSDDEDTLASVLQSAGYATASFGAGNPYISGRFGYNRGFDTFEDFLSDQGAALQDEAVSTGGAGWASRVNRFVQKSRPALGPLAAIYDELYFNYCQRVTPVAKSLDELRRFPAADVIVDHACEWLGTAKDGPFFLWLHLMDPHSPYYPKGEALRLMGEAQVSPFRARYLNCYWNRGDLAAVKLARRRKEVVSLYDAGVRWVDEQIGRLVRALRKAGRWDRCIFVFTADHGEEFLDHGGRYHPPSAVKEELIHVPLMVRDAGARKVDVSRSAFSLLHLAPTLLEATGHAIPDSFRGRSHWEEIQCGDSFDEPAIVESVAGCTNPFRPENRMGPRVLVIRDARYKLIWNFDAGKEDFYDLEADPGEQSPLPENVQKSERRRLLEIAREHLLRGNAERDSRPSVRARLRDLRLEWEHSAKQAS